MRTKYPALTLLVCLFSFGNLASSQVQQDEAPYIFVLGVAQDAGYPQAGCYQPHCLPGWEDKGLRRGAASIAVINPAHRQKVMFDATPNFPEQLYALDREAPNSEFEFAGIFLTHAHIGHYAGLMFLGHEVMGASQVPVFAMPRMSEYLKSNGPWSQLVDYENISLQPLKDNTPATVGSLRVTAMLVPHRDEYSETVGYRIDGPNKSAVFIPDINKWQVWDSDIAQVVKSVDYALVDASFYADGELPGRDMSKVPHPLVTETMDLLQDLPRKERGKVWFIHMNHTNPLLDVDSEQHQHVLNQGFNIATEGLRLDL
jgi:pyrroloquinoline quinone biosynthesis protein B